MNESNRIADSLNVIKSYSNIIQTTLGPRSMLKMIIDSRGNIIVTMLNGNPIQMLRYYVFGIQTGKIKVECGKLCKSRCKCLDFNNYCRNHSFKNCDRGRRCKYIHVN